MIALNRILVATDFSDCADAALKYGREFAANFGATLHVLHVVQDPYALACATEGFAAPLGEVVTQWEQEARTRMLASIPEGERMDVIIATMVGSPQLGICDYAVQEHIDLIIVGTHGRGALAHLVIGSIAERVVRRANCPVLTVHHPQHEFLAA
jgi:nucleotide-binding universal stress UspA family protein